MTKVVQVCLDLTHMHEHDVSSPKVPHNPGHHHASASITRYTKLLRVVAYRKRQGCLEDDKLSFITSKLVRATIEELQVGLKIFWNSSRFSVVCSSLQNSRGQKPCVFS